MPAAPLPMASVDFRPPSKRTSHKIFGPTAFPDETAPFFILPFERTSGKRCPVFQRPRVQGLATLFTVVLLSHLTLGSLFQPPTLMGFTLQSFSPFRRSETRFPASFPLLHFAAKPKRPCIGAPAIYSHLKSRVPHCTPKD